MDLPSTESGSGYPPHMAEPGSISECIALLEAARAFCDREGWALPAIRISEAIASLLEGSVPEHQ